MMHYLTSFILTHEAVLYWIAGLSLIAFLAGLMIIPWLVIRIPADYFAGRRRSEKYKIRHDSLLAWLLLIVKNIIGGMSVLLGIALLVLPGQGVLMIMIGIALMNFPGKFRLERWIVSRGSTLKVINRFRRSRGKPALILEGESRAR
jgi:hypothetical protein